MVPLGLCRRVFINVSSIGRDVQSERREQTLLWAPFFSEGVALDSRRDPLARHPALGSQRPQRGGGAELLQVQTPCIPGAGVHSVISILSCVCCHLLCAVNEQDPAAARGSHAGLGVGET